MAKLLREGPALAGLLLSQFRKPPRDVKPTGKRRPVLVIPGFFADDRATKLLRRTLERAGHRAFGWSFGFNGGARADTLDRLGERLDRITVEAGAPVALVGWSLGGLFARELAKRRPDDVELVVTLGSPFSGDPRANNAWRLYELVNDHKVDNPPIEIELGEKPPVRTIALWSRRDGIIAIGSARGQEGEADERVELRCTHMGFAYDPAALRALLEVLGR